MSENPNVNVNSVSDVPITTTTTEEGPNCLCCEPPQPLEPPATGNYWTCPVTGKKYTYDPAVGGAPVLVTPRQQQPEQQTAGQTVEIEDEVDEEENPDGAPIDDQRLERSPGRRIDPTKRGDFAR